MGIETKLTVDVEELKKVADDISSECERVEEAITTLIGYLQYVLQSGLTSGQAADSFVAFSTEISNLKGNINDSGVSLKTSIKNYLVDIDDADDLLFKNKGYKPFTDEEFKACFAAVENTAAPSLNRDRTYGFFSDALNKIYKFICSLVDVEVTVGNDESILRNEIDNLKEQTVEKISTIKNGVRIADRTYRQKINNQLEALKAYEESLNQIYSIISTPGGAINANDITVLTEHNKRNKSILSSPGEVTDDTVKYFSENVSDYFDSSTTVIDEVCAASLGQWVTSDFDVYRTTVRSALEHFNSYSNHYVESYDQYKNRKSDFDKMLELYNKYGSKWVDKYDGKKKMQSYLTN